MLREILLWEFGASLRENPEFSPMLESIERVLDSEPAMSQQFLDLLRALRS